MAVVTSDLAMVRVATGLRREATGLSALLRSHASSLTPLMTPQSFIVSARPISNVYWAVAGFARPGEPGEHFLEFVTWTGTVVDVAKFGI